MCMITFVPAGVAIPDTGIINGTKINGDGHGWAVASGSEILVGKSMDATESLAKFKEARAKAGEGSLGLFHSRIGTSGVYGPYNVHPFWVGEGETTVLAHNGVLGMEYWPDKGDSRSDTRIFVDRVVGSYVSEETGLPSRRRGGALGKRIGTGNKFVMMSVKTGKPKARIINSEQGIWSKGVWYSNNGYCRTTIYDWRNGYGEFDGFSWRASDAAHIGKKALREDLPEDWLEDHIESNIVNSSVNSSKSLTLPPWGTECDVCNTFGEIDIASNICQACWTCLDCYLPARHCECNYGFDADSVVSTARTV